MVGSSVTDQVLCLVGPPASGKTVLAGRLQREAGALTVRLRAVLCAAARVDEGIGRAVATTADELGWVPDEVVDAAFRAVLIPAHPLGDELRRHRILVFDNFPGRPSQVPILTEHLNDPASALGGRRVATIALDAASAEIRRRAAGRRICPACSDSTTDESCVACGTRTVRRPDDRRVLLEAKLARYRANAEEMRSALASVGPVAGPEDGDRAELLCGLVGEGV